MDHTTGISTTGITVTETWRCRVCGWVLEHGCGLAAHLRRVHGLRPVPVTAEVIISSADQQLAGYLMAREEFFQRKLDAYHLGWLDRRELGEWPKEKVPCPYCGAPVDPDEPECFAEDTDWEAGLAHCGAALRAELRDSEFEHIGWQPPAS